MRIRSFNEMHPLNFKFFYNLFNFFFMTGIKIIKSNTNFLYQSNESSFIPKYWYGNERNSSKSTYLNINLWTTVCIWEINLFESNQKHCSLRGHFLLQHPVNTVEWISLVSNMLQKNSYCNGEEGFNTEHKSKSK